MAIRRVCTLLALATAPAPANGALEVDLTSPGTFFFFTSTVCFGYVPSCRVLPRVSLPRSIKPRLKMLSVLSKPMSLQKGPEGRLLKGPFSSSSLLFILSRRQPDQLRR
jgi:hypothetical protein